MEKLYEVRSDPRFDLIVLDTPPTTNALDFLDAPQKLVGAIDSPVMRWFVAQLEQHEGQLGLMSRGAAFVLRGLARFTGAQFLEQMGQFLVDVNELFGGFRERASAVYDGLRRPDVAFLIVTSPAPMSVAEAVFFSDRLDEYGIRPLAVVVNRVHPVLASVVAPDPAALAAIAPGTDAAGLSARMVRAAEDARLLGDRDREGIRRLREHVGAGMAYTEVPAFDRDVHDLGALAELSAYLVEREAA